MTFKLLSKNNVGIATVLLLVVLLSQSRVFNFLVDSALGRTLLILLLILISYTNKILGVVSVLLIIIMFNNSDIGYMEGFADKDPTSMAPPTTSSPSGSSTTTTTTSYMAPPTTSSPTTSSPTTSPSMPPMPPMIPKINSTEMESSEIDKKLKEEDETTKAAEGFDILGTERTLQKGKNANSISVNSNVRNSDSINAFDSSTPFSSLFAPF